MKCPTFSTDGDELNALAGDEVKSLVDVGDLVEPHLTAIWKRWTHFGQTIEMLTKLEEMAV